MSDATLGTRDNPHPVNTQYPESNGTQISHLLLDKFDHGDYTYIAHEFKTLVAHGDYNKWEARAEPDGRSIQFKGPLIPCYEKAEILHNPDCHNVKDKNTHPFPHNKDAERAQMQLEVAVEEDPNRGSKYFVASMPVALNNSVLSGASNVVKKKARPVKDPNSKDGKKNGLLAVWTIVEKGGTRTRKVVDDEDVFDM